MAFTKPNIEKVIGKLGTTPEQRGLSTQEFKDQFDEMPDAIQQYIRDTLIAELDAFKQDYLSHKADYVQLLGSSGYQKLPNGLIIQWRSVAGTVVADSIGGLTVQYPIAFPNTVFVGFADMMADGGSSDTKKIIGVNVGVSKNYMIIHVDTPSVVFPRHLYCFAIGW